MSRPAISEMTISRMAAGTKMKRCHGLSGREPGTCHFDVQTIVLDTEVTRLARESEIGNIAIDIAVNLGCRHDEL